MPALLSLLRHILQTLQEFGRHNGSSYAAAIAYHAIISLGPCLLLSMGILSRVFDETAVKAQVIYSVGNLGGSNIALLLSQLLEDLASPQSGGSIAWITGGVILYASTNVFRQIVIALNAIWEVDSTASEEGASGIAKFIRSNGFALMASVGIVLVLFMDVLLSTMINLILGSVMGQPILITLLPWLTTMVLACLLFLVCWLTFTLVPNVRLRWRDTRPGALLTGCVLAVGGGIIGHNVSHSPIPNLLGVASGVVILMLWMFFSAFIFLLGAEFTRTSIRG